ncbi:carbonate dehydratase [Frankia sp. CcI156]|uniref:SulP family inorganic anion transporter n=1 Tax=Frankia TaxID=1854 RepID=UPI0003CFA9E2|nr:MULTISPECIES: bifunctional SulP family inorganic anion transporter/carbonic anhydrase [Frankia]ETA00004.1 sulfate permease-like transporter, MFS superfamily [Frankia sp. CcI6]KDA41848.1 sulfate permease-like transporter, MFS superfamily [Frankia sp. BMG5.23]OAA19998.1 carbonic anhydrase [Frankia casuarinae]OHV52400.1 carbonate dehydratase [Frankia sp. CgIS1]ONH22857.1 carbonate dehydratase [Frankia sp. CcI156]
MTASVSPPSPSRHSHSPPMSGSTAKNVRRTRGDHNPLRPDLQASLVVFVVALPLSLGIAVASGAPVAAGLLAAVIGGVVAGALGGAPLQVSGPAAGLTVIVADLVHTYGWRVTCLITAGAGILQILLGLCRVARASLAVSPAIVHGMLGGIGLTIVLGQFHVVLGGQAESHAWENVAAVPEAIIDPHGFATLVGFVTIATILLWPRLPKRLPNAVRAIPAYLAAVVTGTLLAAVAGFDLPRVDLPSSLFDAVALPGLPHGDWSGIALGVVTVAIVASVESLLSAVAVDQLATTRGWRGPRVDLDRELLGQGSANLVSGLAGGLPITGVIVRSSTNVASGGRTRKSAVLHGVWVLLFAVFLGRMVEWVPLSALAGLLVVVGARLVNVAHLRHVRRHGELPVYLVTIVGVVALDLLQGVALGLLTALALVLRRVLWSSVRLVRTGELWQVEVEGTLSFLSLPRLARILGRIPAGAPVSIELIVDYLDHAAYEHLRGWCANHEASGGTVSVDEIGQVWFRRPAEVAEQRRRTVVPHLPRWFAPWSQWQELELASSSSDSPSSDSPSSGSRSSDSQPAGVTPPAIHPVQGPDPAASVPAQASPDRTFDHVSTMLFGVNEFHRRAAPLLRGTFDALAGGQQPGALFLTCADSRIVPNIITSSGPGDLFTIRNVGNIVPVDDPAGSDPDAPLRRSGDLSVTAALDYAVDVLRVPSLVVCGHSGCGAMQALLSGTLDGAPDSALAGWLSHAAASLERTPPAGTEDLPPVERLGRANVAQQLENLRAHPAVRRALARGTLELVGLYFDIADARIWVLEESTGRFVDPMDALPTAVIGTGSRRRWDAPVRVPAPMVAVGAGPADEQPPPAGRRARWLGLPR